MKKKILFGILTGVFLSISVLNGVSVTEKTSNLQYNNTTVIEDVTTPSITTVFNTKLTNFTENQEVNAESEKQDNNKYIVIADKLNIRDSYSIESNIVGTYIYGEQVIVIEKQGVWYKTEKGFCHSDYLKLQEPINNQTYTVKATVLNIRSRASMSSNIVGTYIYGEQVIVIEKQGVWYKTEKGFCHSDYLFIYEPETINSDVYKNNETTGIYAPLHIDDFINKKSNLSVSQIDLILSKTKIEDISYAIKDVEEKCNINSFVIIAIARLESANGTSKIAKNKNNLFGLGAYDSNPYKHAMSFSNPADSVYKFGDVIERIYFNEGRNTLKKINQKYATDQSWKSKVIKIIKEDYKKIINSNYK